MRYQISCIVQRTTPLVALAPLSFVVLWAGGSVLELSDTTAAGYEIVSRSDVNGGHWTVRARLADAGALTVLADTQVDPGPNPVHLMLRFDATDNPRLSFLVNGTEFGALQGFGNMPNAASGNVQNFGLVQGLGVGGGAGQVDRHVAWRWTIDELGGFPR